MQNTITQIQGFTHLHRASGAGDEFDDVEVEDHIDQNRKAFLFIFLYNYFLGGRPLWSEQESVPYLWNISVIFAQKEQEVNI